MILRDLNTTGRRTLSADLPIACIPIRLRLLVGPRGTRDRRAFECAVLIPYRYEHTAFTASTKSG
jgi:hypothetical protein